MLFCFSLFNAQNKNLDFNTFAKKQDSLMLKAYYSKNSKDFEKVLKEFETKYQKLPKDDKENFQGYYSNGFYNLACLYSLLNNKEKALINLEKSIKEGQNDYVHIQKDSDLDNIRNEEKYKSLVKFLNNNYNYLEILKKSDGYEKADYQSLPKFTYQDKNNPNLVALREKYKLDSVAGKGKDATRLINILHYAHYLVKHNGSGGLPYTRNSLNIISECKAEKKGVNCRGMAMVLNDMYLSMGYKSRYVSCIPKDSLKIDTDTHAITMVFANDIKKWVLMDPSFDLYVMNEKGELLGIDELRDRLINDKPLILNPDANHNRENSIGIKDQLYNYMAKNLYFIECPLHSEFDYETPKEGKAIEFVRLVPSNHYEKSLEDIIVDDKMLKRIKHKTHNADYFWQKPE